MTYRIIGQPVLQAEFCNRRQAVIVFDLEADGCALEAWVVVSDLDELRFFGQEPENAADILAACAPLAMETWVAYEALMRAVA